MPATVLGCINLEMFFAQTSSETHPGDVPLPGPPSAVFFHQLCKKPEPTARDRNWHQRAEFISLSDAIDRGGRSGPVRTLFQFPIATVA